MADVRLLPVPVAEVWDWQMWAACRGMDSAVFFHPDGERGPSRAGREARAKRICEGCPVRRQCLGHALAVREPYGVWGGLSAAERAEQEWGGVVRIPVPRRTTITERVIRPAPGGRVPGVGRPS